MLIGLLAACSSQDQGATPTQPTEALTAHAVPSALLYTGPEQGSAVFTEWEPGDLLYIGSDNANLRPTPDTEHNAVAAMVLGEAVMILERVGQPVVLSGHRNHWYRVRVGGEGGSLEGYVFGSLLTPICTAADLDGYSSHKEITALTFSTDFKPQVHVRDPGQPDRQKRTQSITLDIPIPEGRSGGVVSLEIIDQDEASWSLISVRLCWEANDCAVGLATWLNPAQGEDVLSAIPLPSTPLQASQLSDIAVGSDWLRLPGQSHSLYTSDGRFQRQDCHRCGTGFPIQPQPVQTLLERGDTTCTRFARIMEGSYSRRPMVSCVTRQPNREGHLRLTAARFVVLESDTWVYLPNSSTGPVPDDILSSLDITLRTDDRTHISGLTPIDILREDAAGRVRYAHHAPMPPGEAKVVGSHPLLGSIYAAPTSPGKPEVSDDTGEAVEIPVFLGDFAIPQLDGGALVYRFEPDLNSIKWSIQSPPDATYNAHSEDCNGQPMPLLVEVGLERADLTEVGQIASQPLYSLTTPAHTINRRLYADYQQATQPGISEYSRPRAPAGLSQADFSAAMPHLLLQDPFGRYIRLLHADFQPPLSCD